MTKHGAALGAARPIAAGAVFARREGATVRLRAGQQVVTVGRKTDARNHPAVLGQRGMRAKLVVVAVKVIDVLCHDLALKVLPGTAADALPRIDGWLAVGGLRAEIGAPGFGSGTGGRRQLLTVAVGALDAGKVGALAGPDAGHKECHVRRLRRLWRRRLLRAR